MSDIKTLKVNEIMTKNVMVCNKSNNLYQVMKFFAENRVHHIPVVDEDKVVGIISVKDIVSKLYTKLYVDNKTKEQIKVSKITAEEIMTKDPITVNEETPILQVRELLSKAPFSCVPVLDSNNKLVGIVTTKDIIRTKIIHIDGANYGGY